MRFKIPFLIVILCSGVTAFGRITPSETADANTSVIQAALDAAANEPVPGTVVLDAGVFEIDAQLMVTGGVTLVGQGWQNTVIKQTTIGIENNAANGRCATVRDGSKIEGVTLTGGHIRKNWESGAGVLVNDGTISRCCVIDNQIGDSTYQSATVNNIYGAGISIAKGTVEHTIVASNAAYMNGGGSSHGGGIGIYNTYNKVLIDTCLIYGNIAPNGNGGGILLSTGDPDVTIRNTTIAGNSSANGGGICDDIANHGVKLVNCIVFGNTATAGDPEVRGNLASGSSNNMIGVDPLFIDAANDDYHLFSSSPAIGGGIRYEGIGTDIDAVQFDDPPSIGCYECSDVTENPVFAAVSGTKFFPSMEVALSCATEGANIYYTTDGSTPTYSSSLYTGPFEIDATTTVNARAYAEGKAASGVVSATYTLEKPTPKPKDFKKFIEITLNRDLHSAEGESISGVPALVKLGKSIEGFNYSDFSLSAGEDMMFVDADGEVLPHEVDTWDTAGESLVWVKLPSTSAQTVITMYYGRGSVSPKSAKDVWVEYEGVWHFEQATPAAVEHSYGTYANSTATEGIDGNVAEHAVTNAPGRFGKCFRVNDSDGKVSGKYMYGGVWVNDSGSGSPVDGGENFTISGWFKHGDFDYYWDHLFYKRQKSLNTGSPLNAFAIECNSQVGAPNPLPRGSSAGGTQAVLSTDMRDEWAYLTFVYDGIVCRIYENGVHKGDSGIARCIDNDSPLVFGNNCDVASGKIGDAAWNGWIDEVRYSKGSKSAEWVNAEYKAMNAGQTDIFTYARARRSCENGILISVR